MAPVRRYSSIFSAIASPTPGIVRSSWRAATAPRSSVRLSMDRAARRYASGLNFSPRRSRRSAIVRKISVASALEVIAAPSRALSLASSVRALRRSRGKPGTEVEPGAPPDGAESQSLVQTPSLDPVLPHVEPDPRPGLPRARESGLDEHPPDPSTPSVRVDVHPVDEPHIPQAYGRPDRAEEFPLVERSPDPLLARVEGRVLGRHWVRLPFGEGDERWQVRALEPTDLDSGGSSRVRPRLREQLVREQEERERSGRAPGRDHGILERLGNDRHEGSRREGVREDTRARVGADPMDDGPGGMAQPDKQVADGLVTVDGGDEPDPVRGVVEVPEAVGMSEGVPDRGAFEPLPVDRRSELHRAAPVALSLPTS